MKKTQRIYAMTIVVALVLLTSFVKAQERSATIGIGINKSHANGSELIIVDEASYYIQVGYVDRVGKYMGFGADIQFSQHRNNFEILNESATLNVHTIDISCYYKVYPVDKINLSLGFQGGFTTLAKIEKENIKADPAHFGALAGVGYQFGRYAVNFRAIRAIGDIRLFDHVMQLGISYKI